MKTLGVCLLVGAITLPCMGAASFFDEVDIDSTIWEANIFGYQFGNTTTEWTHTIGQEVVDSTILTASLTIDVSGICEQDELFSPEDDHVSIFLNGAYLGDLTGLETVFSGTSVIDALTVTELGASASIEWDWAGDIHFADAANILTSTLEGTYEARAYAVPAPSAIFLAGIGTTLIGVLRKRS